MMRHIRLSHVCLNHRFTAMVGYVIYYEKNGEEASENGDRWRYMAMMPSAREDTCHEAAMAHVTQAR